MRIVYDKYRDREITYPDGVVGIVCGFTGDNLLLATKDRPSYAFRTFGKEEHTIEEKYKDKIYKYTYCSEKTAEEQCTPTNNSQK